MSSDQLMPAVFIGHGSPMNTLEHNRFTQAWNEFGRTIPRPRAILAISAHWYVNALAVTAMPDPRTIHDFMGFPDELFAFDYPAIGDPDLAIAVADILRPDEVILDRDSWGIDHGTWSVLAHMFPKADIPVVQLSLDRSRSFEDHLGLARRLHPLRTQGVLVLCSGNVVHNLGMMSWSHHDGGFDWALDFDAATREVMTTEPATITDLRRHDAWTRAVPTPDHFLPLVYLAGLADAAHQTGDVLVGGPVFDSLTMTCFALSGHAPTPTT